jgi:hypothetical protein
MTPMLPIHHLPAAGHADMAWKNGLGRTAEIAREPVGGAVFDWRLSIATIAADGPFSAFEGCDRSLVPIAGAGLALEFADGTVLSGGLFETLAFAGERACHGRLLGQGPTRDLNVITRRAAASHAVVLTVPPAALTTAGDTSFVVALDGTLAVAAGTGRWRLGTHDALRIDGPGVALLLTKDHPAARAAVVTLTKRAA